MSSSFLRSPMQLQSGVGRTIIIWWFVKAGDDSSTKLAAGNSAQLLAGVPTGSLCMQDFLKLLRFLTWYLAFPRDSIHIESEGICIAFYGLFCLHSFLASPQICSTGYK